jgi:hypothetical protein
MMPVNAIAKNTMKFPSAHTFVDPRWQAQRIINKELLPSTTEVSSKPKAPS